jgi:hypothetical protein
LQRWPGTRARPARYPPASILSSLRPTGEEHRPLPFYPALELPLLPRGWRPCYVSRRFLQLDLRLWPLSRRPLELRFPTPTAARAVPHSRPRVVSPLVVDRQFPGVLARLPLLFFAAKKTADRSRRGPVLHYQRQCSFSIIAYSVQRYWSVLFVLSIAAAAAFQNANLVF